MFSSSLTLRKTEPGCFELENSHSLVSFCEVGANLLRPGRHLHHQQITDRAANACQWQSNNAHHPGVSRIQRNFYNDWYLVFHHGQLFSRRPGLLLAPGELAFLLQVVGVSDHLGLFSFGCPLFFADLNASFHPKVVLVPNPLGPLSRQPLIQML